MKQFNIDQLTKEMVVARLSELGDPCTAASDVAKRTLLAALRGRDTFDAEGREIVTAVCQGAMTGLLLSEQDLVKGAVQLLHRVCEAATELHLDPTELMEHAMRGIVDIRRFAEREKLMAMSAAIETEFMGAGTVFSRILYEAFEEKTPTPRAGKT